MQCCLCLVSAAHSLGLKIWLVSVGVLSTMLCRQVSLADVAQWLYVPKSQSLGVHQELLDLLSPLGMTWPPNAHLFPDCASYKATSKPGSGEEMHQSRYSREPTQVFCYNRAYLRNFCSLVAPRSCVLHSQLLRCKAFFVLMGQLKELNNLGWTSSYASTLLSATTTSCCRPIGRLFSNVKR